MKITKIQNKIIIENEFEFEFNIVDILECGQVFSYNKIGEDKYIVVSGNKFAEITFDSKKTVIDSSDCDYFYNYFDLETNYENIKSEILSLYPNFNKFFTVGKSIRILKQEPYQTIISFIVSANNNIKRIKKILHDISAKFGSKLTCNEYSFPTLIQLSKAKKEDFDNLKAGYRSDYLVKTIQSLQTKEYEINYLNSLSTNDLRKHLLKLQGVGPKVADCILFFGFSRTDVFPVDTWIRKSYKMFNNTDASDKQISQFFVSLFKNYSGYAQQYIFNYMIK